VITRTSLACAVCLLFVGRLAAVETLVKDVAEFDVAMKAAKPGDEIVLADGEWRDAKLVVRGEGEVISPILVRPQTPGRVVFTGASSLRIGGKHVNVRDLLWKECEAESEVIAFRIDSKSLAQRCRLESCAIIGDRPTKGDRKWVSIYGSHNGVLKCRFEGKQSAGTLLVVWLGQGLPKNEHSIGKNFFGARQRLGKNGGEIIRIGDSKTSLQQSGTYVFQNHFYRCDGEAEIISNKSCENAFFGNLFVGCGGALTLRHGNGCNVDGNAFFGDGRKGTGGVRIIGERHNVRGNLFHALEGDGGRAAVSLMNGIPDSPADGYFQIKKAWIAQNTFIDCRESLIVGLSDEDRKKQTLEPLDCVFFDNLALTSGPAVFTIRKAMGDAGHGDNFFHGGELGIDGLPRPSCWRRLPARPAFDLAKLEYPAVGDEGNTLDSSLTFGIFRTAVVKTQSLETFVTQLKETGPAWMRPGDDYLPAVLKASAGATAK
jgi:poly(beta-D-mannuronate) lyase